MANIKQQREAVIAELSLWGYEPHTKFIKGGKQSTRAGGIQADRFIFVETRPTKGSFGVAVLAKLRAGDDDDERREPRRWSELSLPHLKLLYIRALRHLVDEARKP